jgi:hypothetical protein
MTTAIRPGAAAVLIATCVLCFPLGSARAEALGRLFTTPQQRAVLERLRHAPPPAPKPKVVEQPKVVVPPPPEVPRITVNGVVIRSDGDSTAWVNGQSTGEGRDEIDSVQVNPRRIRGLAVPITTPSNLPDVRLKPGQSYDPATGTVVDIYQQQK